MSDYTSYLVQLVYEAPTWISILILFSASCIEYIFPFFPGDTIIVAGGFFAARGAIPLVTTFITLALGTLTGCVIAWAIGRRFGTQFISTKSLLRLEKIYARFGNWVLLFNRFVPGIRAAFMIAAGMANISLKKIMILGTISAVVWNSLLIALGYFFSANLDTLIQLMQQYATVVLILLAVIAMGFFMKSFWKSLWPFIVMLVVSISSCQCKPKIKRTPQTTVDFLEASTITAQYHAQSNELVVKVSLQPRVHAYAPGETVGRPIELLVNNTNGWHLSDKPEYPIGNPLLEGEFEIRARVIGGQGDIHGILKLQLCTDYACDRPREHPFEVQTK